MAGLPWFELDTDFADDPKVSALCSRLREPLADAYVARVYAYCYRHAQDRFDAAVAADTIENAARWRGRRGVLFDALFAVEVLERDGQKVVVHGVKERLGPHLAKRVVDAVRQKKHRKKAEESIGRNAGVTRDITRDVTGESRSNKDKDKDIEATTPPRETPRQAGAADRLAIVAGLSTRDEVLSEKYPKTSTLIDACAAVKCRAAWAKDAETRALVEDAVGDQPVDAAMVERVTVAIAETGKPWLGHHTAVIRGKSKTKDIRLGIAPPAAHEAFGQGGERVIE